jgi:hypothetical protein
VSHPQVVATQENFPKFVSSMENPVAILNSYTYDSSSKKVSQRIVKKIKIDEYLEEEVTEQQVLMENTFVNPMATTMVN